MKRFVCSLILLAAASFGNNTVSQTIETFAGNGSTGYSDGGGVCTNAEFNHPWGITFDASGNLYIADHVNSAIRRVNASNAICTYAGTTSFGYSGDNGPATAATMLRPSGLAVSSAGDLFLADGWDNRIRKVGADGVITTFGGTGIAGYAGDGGQATAAMFDHPTGLALDVAGNLYVADSGNHVVRKITPAGIVSTYAGNGHEGYSGDGGPATAAQLFEPRGVAMDATGNLYITDIANMVRKVTPAGIITTFAGTGMGGYSGDDGPATAAQLLTPNSVAFDKVGNVYISDENNHAIRKVNSAGIITTIAGTGTAGYSGNGGPASYANFYRPMGIAFDTSGNLYIADYINSVIRRIGMQSVIAAVPGQKENVAITMYPVPVRDYLNVEVNTAQTGLRAEIQDVTGRLLCSIPFKMKARIDLSAYAQGTYIVSCYADGTKVSTQRILKN